MTTFFKKFIGAFKQYRFGIIWILLNKLYPDKISYHNFIVYHYNLQKDLPETAESDKSTEIKKVENTDDELFKKFCEKFPADEFVSRLKKENETLFIAIKKGEVVAYAWVARRELFIDAINYLYKLNDDEIFLYSCYVSREYRGEGIHNLLINQRLKNYINDSSFKSAYTGVLSPNKGSIKGVKKAGFSEYKKVKYLNFFDKKKWWFR